MTKKKAHIIGAGPAGLTAAYELLKNTDILPIIHETSMDIGGISKTINYKGNRIDIGGHRFFSKSERVMNWWLDIMPLQSKPSADDIFLNRTSPLAKTTINADPEKTDLVFLIRKRLSRIFFLRTFFDYPISLNFDTFRKLGFLRILKICWTYTLINVRPIKGEQSLEEFFINRFGSELYETFFKDYTEKVWGVSCKDIPADWGIQRIKGLSVKRTINHAVKSLFIKDNTIPQKDTETSLIGQFLYPKLGPGQLWEEVARKIIAKGGEIHLGQCAVGVEVEANTVTSVTTRDKNGRLTTHSCDYLISTMPVKDLISAMTGDNIPANVKEVAAGLTYRDFITVGLLLNKLLISNDTKHHSYKNIIPDNWIYIQEKNVKLGRLQIFNNWSPYLVSDPDKVWIGLEYFCNENDSLWNKTDQDFIDFAVNELESIGFIDKDDVIDSTILRVLKTYPAYFGTFDRFSEIRSFTDDISNLYLIGRNGMHRYNNTDHSMLTAMLAVEEIITGALGKKHLWDVNTEKEYHEQKGM